MSTPIIIGGGPPHVQRMAEEYNALNDKITKIKAFIGSQTFAGLSQEEQENLCEQMLHMCRYENVLLRRYETAMAKHERGEA